MGGGPLLRGQQHHGRTVGQRRGVAGRHGRRRAPAEHRLEGGELLHRGVGAQVLVALETAERRQQVVEEAPLVRRREPVVGGGRELVLLLPADLPLHGGQRGVLAHGQPGAGLAVLRDVESDVAGPDRRQGGESALEVAGRVDLHQLAAEPVADSHGSVGGGVGAAGDADLELAERDLVGDLDDGLETGPAGLLEVGSRGLGGQLGAQHRLAGQVEVPGVLEHRARDHLADPLALEPEPGDEAVEGGGEHLAVGGVAVDGVGPGEGDAVATEDGDATGRGGHGPIITRQ